ncbi:MAG: hypothetical protein D6797_05190 [Bdellovibrio sp.]|nr:MAG: hypothetical protein D6797_05190 [Bdellovibrio sp.]
MLVLDDYNELVYLQSLLRKLSLDVEAIQNQKAFENTRLGFLPQMIIATAKGKKIDGLNLVKGVRKVRGTPAIVLLKDVSQTFDQRELEKAQVDEVLDSPVNVHKLLECLSRYSGQSMESLLAKYNRFKESQRTKEETKGKDSHYEGYEKSDVKIISSKHSLKDGTSSVKLKSSLMDSQRREKFEAFLKKTSPIQQEKSFSRKRILEYNKMIRSEEKPDYNDELESSRQDFVKALFTSPPVQDDEDNH